MKKISTIVFCLILAILCIGTLVNSQYIFDSNMYGDNVYRNTQNRSPKYIENRDDFERNLSNDIVLREMWLSTYNGVRNLMLPYMSLEYNDVIKTIDGYLFQRQKNADKVTNFINYQREFDSDIENIVAFNDALKNRNIPFVFYAAPNRFVKNKVIFKNKQVIDYSNDNQDKFLRLLAENNIKNVDLRQYNDFKNLSDFYMTDHHWKISSAFNAGYIITKDIEKILGEELEIEYYFDMKNFNKTLMLHSYVGSYGRRVDPSFYDLDDIEIITPSFDTNFDYSYYNHDGCIYEVNGRFEDVLVSQKYAEQNKSLYSSYLYGYIENRIVNNKANNDYTVLVIADSFGRPMVPFMANVFHEVCYVDPQISRFNRNIVEYVDEIKPDAVIMLNNAFSTYLPIILQ